MSDHRQRALDALHAVEGHAQRLRGLDVDLDAETIALVAQAEALIYIGDQAAALVEFFRGTKPR